MRGSTQALLAPPSVSPSPGTHRRSLQPPLLRAFVLAMALTVMVGGWWYADRNLVSVARYDSALDRLGSVRSELAAALDQLSVLEQQVAALEEGLADSRARVDELQREISGDGSTSARDAVDYARAYRDQLEWLLSFVMGGEAGPGLPDTSNA